MAITQLECFKSTVAHDPHEGVLATAGYTPDLSRRLRERYGLASNESISRHLGFFEPQGVAPGRRTEAQKEQFWPYYEDIEVPEGSLMSDWGILRLHAGFYHFKHLTSPLRNVDTFDEIKAFPYPRPEDYENDPTEMAEKVEKIHANGLVAKGQVGHIFETSWQIRGMEPFLMEMITNPERCDYIFDRVYEVQKARACAMARAGVDYIHTGDDVASQVALMFDIDKWRYFLKSRWGDIYAAVREINPDIHIWYHSDGNIMDIIPELIEIGVDMLNPVQPECMDPFEVKRRFGKDLVLYGCIGTQSTMPFDTPDEVRNTVREYIEKLGDDGGLILGPTHILEPEVPIENIEAYAETAKEYGDIIPAPAE